MKGNDSCDLNDIFDLTVMKALCCVVQLSCTLYFADHVKIWIEQRFELIVHNSNNIEVVVQITKCITILTIIIAGNF